MKDVKVSRGKVSDLTPDPHNANEGTERGLRALEDSIQATGLGRSIVTDKNGVVIGGNKTLERVADLGFEDTIVVSTDGNQLVVVQRTDLDLLEDDDKRARSLAYFDNRTSELDLSWNPVQLQADKEAGIEIVEKLWSPVELGILGVGDGEQVPDPGADVDRAAELNEKWQVGRGDVWQVGRHRIMCGDSTCADDVDKLMDGVKAQLMVTDPPYGVNYDQEWRSNNRIGKVTNDDNYDWREAFSLFGGDILYVWCASWMLDYVVSDIRNVNFDIRNLIIWNKPCLVMGRGHYHWKHEPCWYAVRSNATASWIGDRKQTTVWDIESDADVPGGHSTQKPLECMARPIRNHDAAIVYDPFLGSGTTLVACEQVGRVGYGMEISENYVSVCLERLSGLGLTPERLPDA